MSLFKYFFSMLTTFVLLASCSEDNSTNTPTEDWANYFMLETGNYWVFDDYQVDENGFEYFLAGNRRYEVIGPDIFCDRDCIKCESFNSSGNSYYTSYRYVDGSKLFCSGNTCFINMAFNPYPMWDKNNWVLMSNLEKESWIGFEDDNVEKVFNLDISFTGSIKIHGKMGEDTTLTVKGMEYLCKTFINYCDVEGTFTYYGEEIDLGTPYRLTIYSYYSKGVGWLGWRNVFTKPYMPWKQITNIGFNSWVTDFHIEE